MSYKRTLVAAGLMVFTMLFLNYISHGENIQPNRPLSTFPKQIGRWAGKEEHFDQMIYDILGVEDSFLCNYRDSDGRQVQLYVGFYQSQREGDLIHSPRNCMPGAGWNIIRSSLEEVTIPGINPGKIIMNKLNLGKGAQKQVMLYWFQSRGRFIASEYMQKVYLVVDSITRHRTDGSFVRLISPVVNGNEEKTMHDMRSFAKLVIPILKEYIPS
jgi:EpsI family protein